MNLREIDILSLIPQRPPFVMVDKLISFSESESETEFTITSENIFCKNGLFLETGIMENIAQTCAARIGYINCNSGQSVKIGVIGSIKNLILLELPKVGDKIVTKVAVESEIFAVTLVSAQVMCGDRVLASCEMKISLTDKEIG